LPRHTAVLNEHGKQISYEGAIMHDVLALGRIDFGKGLRAVMDSGIILADKREGQALAANEGPLRIVVPHDERPTRSLRLLREIDIVQLKK
jgi:hypothetical protein